MSVEIASNATSKAKGASLLAPLETIALPHELSGEAGFNRSTETPFIPASHDIDAIECWLSRVASLSRHTYTAYKREAERLLLWAIITKRKPMSSLDMTDIGEYRTFLLNPQPKTFWIGRKHNKGHEDWKPFTGPLSKRSVKHSDTILNHLFRFLTEQRYLKQNPYSALPKLKHAVESGTIEVNRSFTQSQWDFISEFLQKNIEKMKGRGREKWIRTHMLVSVFYMTGLRIHELAKARIGDIVQVEREEGKQFWLQVIGKGEKFRQVPLPTSIYEIMDNAYQELMGVPLRQAGDDEPVIPALRKRGGGDFIKPLAIHKILKEFFGLVAAELATIDPKASEKLSRASTHWLRHTHGTHAVDKKIPLTVIRDNMGHHNISTTSQYVHAERDHRYASISKMEIKKI